MSKAGDTLGKVPGVNYGVSFFADYRKFMDRGNVIDLAVAVVIGMFTFFPFQLLCPAMYLSGGCLYVVHFNYPPTNRITKRGRKTPSHSPLFSIANHNLFKRLTNCQLLPVCLPNQLLGAAFTAVSEPLHKRLLRTLTEKLYQTSSLEGGLLLQRKRKGEKDQKTARSSDFGFFFCSSFPLQFLCSLAYTGIFPSSFLFFITFLLLVFGRFLFCSRLACTNKTTLPRENRLQKDRGEGAWHERKREEGNGIEFPTVAIRRTAPCKQTNKWMKVEPPLHIHADSGVKYVIG